ncbi:carboxypeptidase-like regulatory domain-containing protein [Rapidithrix thailandica]|uniref:Carboxypeptidase-like regulatory domain-containing protein n=1 Tax=Rapidithrix thailandica TaxID=413964 RepID=A0AAW9SC50_9BACT
MLRKLRLVAWICGLFLVHNLYAQEKTVTGIVTSAEDGSPLPGVNILVKNTNVGAITDINGKYSISVPQDGKILQFSFIGFTTQEVEIGERTSANVILEAAAQELSVVVVTAMNISREKASLGYSTQELTSESVSKVKESNIVNSLSGKAAGVQVRTNNTMGGSTNIVIRGNNSITGGKSTFICGRWCTH